MPVSNYENSYLATRLRGKDLWNEFLINESQSDFYCLIDLTRLHPLTRGGGGGPERDSLSRAPHGLEGGGI